MTNDRTWCPVSSYSEEDRSRVRICDPGLAARHQRGELLDAFTRVLDSGRYVLADEVRAFEEEFARFLGAKYVVGVASGTDAIEISLRSLGIGRGDVVITSALTSVATVAAIERAGGVVALVDIDPETCTMDPVSLEDTARFISGSDRIVGRLRAVVPVHIYGQVADVTSIIDLARRYHLSMVEDCAQATGAVCDGQSAGTFGDLAAFSFYPTKNLGALGDGGCVATNDADHHRRLLRLRQYGWEQRFVSREAGINSRLDEVQAAMLRVSLAHLEDNNLRRRAIAERYNRTFAALDYLIPPSVRPGGTHCYHLYVVQSAWRDDLAAHLDRAGIDSAIHYPIPIHLQQPYAGDRLILPPGGLPVCEEVTGRILSLPLFPEMTDDEVERVCAAVLSFGEGYTTERTKF